LEHQLSGSSLMMTQYHGALSSDWQAARAFWSDACVDVIHRYHARLLHRLVFAGFSPERGGGARAPDVSDNALFKVQTMPDTRRTADASVPSTQPPPGPKGRGSLELWGPEPGSLSNLPDALPLAHPLRRRLSPWSTRRSPKPVEKGEGNCGAGDWGGDGKDKRILRWMTIALKRHASFFFTKSCARISSPSLQTNRPTR
jgi:hypothetical protein